MREERRRKAAERQRVYRRQRKELEAAEAAAIAAGKEFVPPVKPPKGHHLVPFRYKVGDESSRKGVRNRFTQDFITAFHQHFLQRGIAVFDELLVKEPATYARLLGSVATKYVEVQSTSIVSAFSDDEVVRLVAAIDRWLEESPDPGTKAGVLPALPEAENVP